MSVDLAHEFANYLRSKNHLAGDRNSLTGTAQSQDERTLHKLWELTDLSANDFADEVARFFEVPRIGLPDLLSAPPLANQFSRRFLREMLVFPFRIGARRAGSRGRRSERLRRGPRRRHRARRRRQDRGRLVRGHRRPRSISVSATMTRHRRRPTMTPPMRAKTTSRACAISPSGAPVVRAVNDLLEKAVELRASDIHIEPFRSRADGAPARRRIAARGSGAGRRAAAGHHFPHQDSRRPQHRGAPAAAGRRGAAARRRAPNSTSASPSCRRSTASPR